MSTTELLTHRTDRRPSSPGASPRAGFYERRIFPRILDVIMNTAETRRIREQVCAPLAGEVLEIGFGTGHNLPFLPASVTRLLAVDPLERGQRLARDRLAAVDIDVDLVGLDGQHLPLADASVDAALCTWTLCSVEDPVAAVREVARVLRPGGVLHFVEHGLSPDEKVRRWQHRCNGLQRRVACGCNLDRDIPALLTDGGMTIEALDSYYAKGDPKVLGWTFEGRATVARPAAAPLWPLSPAPSPFSS
jgi:SAM-dependent methyltransferase